MKYFKLTLVNKSQANNRYISLEVIELKKSLNTAIELGQLYPPTKIPRKSIKKGLIIDTVL
jgi:hypothetical protein